MWSRVRHRRLQALSLVALAALLTTSLCLGPLYQRAMEQALAGSVLANASPEQKGLQLTATDRRPEDLEREVPERVGRYLTEPSVSRLAQVLVMNPDSHLAFNTRIYDVDGACARLKVVEGDCPAHSGEVMVSTTDVEQNGWRMGGVVTFVERLSPVVEAEPGGGKITIVGIYEPPKDAGWLDAPITTRVGTKIQDVKGPATNDWVTDPETFTGAVPPTRWHEISTTMTWSIDSSRVGHDELVRLGPLVESIQQKQLENPGGVRVSVATDIPTLSERVATGSEQGRTTVVVLVAQLLVLVAVVLWMVLVAATDDRRPELALARLRGRGRRGAAAFLLSELLPLTLGGVAVGIVVAPLVMAVVAKVVFPVSVPLELPGGFLLAALGSALAVVAVVLAAARRAVREPVDSLLRAVQARHAGTGAGALEVSMIVFSLTAVAALVTGNLEGPLATLAPLLLAVAVGLILGRALAPAIRAASRRLLRSGRAVAGAGIVNAVRRPAARRVLVMVVVASALLVFCVDALVTGQHNRQNAAEQQNGAPYSLTIQASELTDVVAAVAAADPDHEHLTPVVTTTNSTPAEGPTVAVDSAAFPRIAYLPTAGTDPDAWAAIAAPRVEPVRLTGGTMAGTLDARTLLLVGPSVNRPEDLRIGLQLRVADGSTRTADLSVLPRADASITFQAPVPCADGCTVTGVTVATPPGGEATGTVVLRDLSVDGQPFTLGPSTGWRRGTGTGGTVVPAADPAGNLGINMVTTGSAPPVMVSEWVPQPIPALVTSEEDPTFSAPGLETTLDVTVAGTLPWVPGAPPGARLVDLEGLLRRPDAAGTNVSLEVWSDDASDLDRAKTELRKRGVTVAEVTTVGDVRAELDASPAAWSLALSVLVGGAAVLVAMLVMIVAVATTWRARATDLAALRMAGLPGRSLRRMELLGQLPVVLVGAVAGATCGIVAAVLALPGVRQFNDEPLVDTTDFATPWVVVLAAGAISLVLLTVLAVGASRWTARRAPLSRIREVV